ncbi:MAG: hypothetical protein K2L14_08165 [Duncaniella sp.]|nr:hypothetical protein [Duncaniella sp.]
MSNISGKVISVLTSVIFITLVCPFNIFSNSPLKPVRPERRATSPIAEFPDTIPLSVEAGARDVVALDSIIQRGDSLAVIPVDSLAIVTVDGSTLADDQISKRFAFNPDPTRAVWLSALCPGLGQIYNRKYWKLPIVVGGFMGLGYATQWNNTMLRDYTVAYADIMDNDPSTNSYMDFFPPTVSESSLDRTWLRNILKSRKDFYRRNRDLCIISMVGLYLVAMIDAYVDAQLAHFDISPNLTVDLGPALIPDSRSRLPGLGLQWALNF